MVEQVASKAPANAYLLRGSRNSLVVSYIAPASCAVAKQRPAVAMTVAKQPDGDDDVDAKLARDVVGDGLVRFSVGDASCLRVVQLQRDGMCIISLSLSLSLSLTHHHHLRN
jgi:hypothetical protein